MSDVAAYHVFVCAVIFVCALFPVHCTGNNGHRNI